MVITGGPFVVDVCDGFEVEPDPDSDEDGPGKPDGPVEVSTGGVEAVTAAMPPWPPVGLFEHAAMPRHVTRHKTRARCDRCMRDLPVGAATVQAPRTG
jgi:hypothetical protein